MKLKIVAEPDDKTLRVFNADMSEELEGIASVTLKFKKNWGYTVILEVDGVALDIETDPSSGATVT